MDAPKHTILPWDPKPKPKPCPHPGCGGFLLNGDHFSKGYTVEAALYELMTRR